MANNGGGPLLSFATFKPESAPSPPQAQEAAGQAASSALPIGAAIAAVIAAAVAAAVAQRSFARRRIERLARAAPIVMYLTPTALSRPFAVVPDAFRAAAGPAAVAVSGSADA